MEAPAGAKPEQRIYMESFTKNMTAIELLRTVLALVTGALCGILGLTSLWGLLFYVVSSAIVGFAIAVPMGLDTMAYTNVSLPSLVLQGLQGQAMTFIMAWTLAYALVILF